MSDLLNEYHRQHDAYAVPLQVGTYRLKGIQVDLVTEKETRTPGTNTTTLEPGVVSYARIAVFNWPPEWRKLSDGEIIQTVQPLSVTIYNTEYATRGARVGKIRGERAYLDILLAESEFGDGLEEEIFKWETWKRQRLIVSAGEPELGEPAGSWDTADVQVSWITATGDDLDERGDTTARIRVRQGELKKGDLLYGPQGTFQANVKNPQGKYDEWSLIR